MQMALKSFLFQKKSQNYLATTLVCDYVWAASILVQHADRLQVLDEKTLRFAEVGKSFRILPKKLEKEFVTFTGITFTRIMLDPLFVFGGYDVIIRLQVWLQLQFFRIRNVMVVYVSLEASSFLG